MKRKRGFDHEIVVKKRMFENELRRLISSAHPQVGNDRGHGFRARQGRIHAGIHGRELAVGRNAAKPLHMVRRLCVEVQNRGAQLACTQQHSLSLPSKW